MFFKTLKHIALKYKRTALITLIVSVLYFNALPKHLFNSPTATVITSHDGKLLGAKIAKDGQWRFPHNDSIPEKFKQCILLFEDEYFYKHPGFNPVSIFKAFKANWSSGTIKRGGSTITQQVIRLSRKGQARSYLEKIKELILATRLELSTSKENILALYINNAPYGGNVVGLEAASWRYFNRNAHNLSWAEHATLAVLPNAPSLIYPGKHQEQLLKKRNRLLQKLLKKNVIDSLTYTLAIAENLPRKPYPLPQLAPHLLQKIEKTYSGQYVKTSVIKAYQEQINHIVKSHYNTLSQNEIYNAAVLVLDVNTRKILSYVGNTPTDKAHQKDVDVIDKPRSTGSVLKPFLYAALLDSGELLPDMLVADIPTQFGNYTPENYDKTYAGAIPASKALSKSLNIPAVRLLNNFGLDRFHHYLKQLRLKDLKYNANHYGLSLILGGAESNLWDLCKSYAAMSATVNHFSEHSSNYFTNEFTEPSYLASFHLDLGKKTPHKTLFDAASIFLTYQSLKNVNRPEADENWEFFDSSKQIAWKTGTSFGFRDAWAIGTTKNYVVGVWVGNADGEGRPGLVGIHAAAPLLFDVFDILPQSTWFNTPFDEMQAVAICKKSGYRAGTNCNNTTQEYIPISGLKTKACPYHKRIHLDASGTFQVNTSCESASLITQHSWFVLPPIMAHYYKTKNPFYRPLPKYRADCIDREAASIAFIYPQNNTTIFLPKDFDGNTNPVILKLAHSKPETAVFWYVDNVFISSTTNIHELDIKPKPGKHVLTAVDAYGNEAKCNFEIAL